MTTPGIRKHERGNSCMYGSLFCRLYNEFGWNEYPRVFGEQLLVWLARHNIDVATALDLGCGTGVLCETLSAHGIETVGIDLSDSMIQIARERNPALRYEIADMTTFSLPRKFDLITCTGDALNHITRLGDIRSVFTRAHEMLVDGGLLVFDLLRDEEVPDGEPFEDGNVRFTARKDDAGNTTLTVERFQDGELQFTETIHEKVHDVEDVRELLRENGFDVLQCADQLLTDSDIHGTTWFVVARRW